MGVLGFKSAKKCGIAFGGGGTRGIAHIGAVRVFQQSGIEFDYIAGNSAGSMVGAVYALGVPWRHMYDFVLSINERSMFPKKNWASYMSAEVIERMADFYLAGKTFDDLKKPFCAIAVDIRKGTLETLCSGSVSKALSASCAVPGVFRPVEINGGVYVDGGTLRSIPTQAVRSMGAENVVGIDLNSDRGEGTNSLKRGDVFIAAYKLALSVNSEICEQYADIMIKPKLGAFMPYSFKNAEEMLKIGERAAAKRLPEIIRLLKK